MNGMIMGFLIWCLSGGIFALIGIYALFAKKPVGFWANAKVFEVSDVKKYNRAMSKLFLSFSFVFILLGTPLLAGQNSPWAIISVFGVVAEMIVMMIVYTLVIEKKYKKK
ncbi:MAG: hypothetical protein IKM61_06305 [Eubacteriaceae bacterium]|nr:hypothetical protein [Eubacteriaceae bacterium]